MTFSPTRLIVVTSGCAAIGWFIGLITALLCVHPLLSFGSFLLIVLLSMHLAGRRDRIFGVPVNAGRVTAS